jgi:2-methylcitrate dehydratase PrpD
MGSYGHQSAALVPALLAAAQLGAPVSGQELLVAFTLGFEVAMSLFSEGKYDQYDGSFHATSLFGAVAAAGAVSRLLRLTARETSATLELAAGQASGIGRNVGTMVKPLHGGLAANEALTSAVLAAAGIEGFGPIFEGRGGFIETFSRHRTMRPDRVIESLGQPFKASARLAIKAFPCCGSNQSALHAIRRIMTKENLRYEDILDVTVDQMADTSPVLRYEYPQRGLNGKFSIHYTVGNFILKGALTIDDFTDEEVHNPRVIEACHRVRAGVMSRWDEHHTDRVTKGNPVAIRTVDGRTLRSELPRSEMPGSAKFPFSWDELAVKFKANAARELTSPKAVDEASRLWSNLGDISDVNDAIASLSISARPQMAI